MRSVRQRRTVFSFLITLAVSSAALVSVEESSLTTPRRNGSVFEAFMRTRTFGGADLELTRAFIERCAHGLYADTDGGVASPEAEKASACNCTQQCLFLPVPVGV